MSRLAYRNAQIERAKADRQTKILLDAATEARDHMQQYAIGKLSTLVDQVRVNGSAVIVVEPGCEMWNAFTVHLETLTTSAKSTYSPEVQGIVACSTN